MKYGGLFRFVKSRLPIRSRLMGDQRLSELVALSVAAFPTEAMRMTDGDEREVGALRSLIELRVSRIASQPDRGDYGFVGLWTILMYTVLSKVIELVVEWWWKSHTNRALMQAWQANGGRA